jgi:hypothetical protein
MPRIPQVSYKLNIYIPLYKYRSPNKIKYNIMKQITATNLHSNSIWNVPTVWYFLLFHFITSFQNSKCTEYVNFIFAYSYKNRSTLYEGYYIISRRTLNIRKLCSRYQLFVFFIVVLVQYSYISKLQKDSKSIPLIVTKM